MVKQLQKELKMTTAELQTQARELTLQDRCDICSAAAQVVVTFINGELMFCGHHARDKAESLKLKAVTIFDPNNFIPVVE
jgi:hypothetical protein